MLLLLAACGSPEPDTGSPPDTDTGTSPEDTGAAPVDTGAWPSTGLPDCEALERDTAGILADCTEPLVWNRSCERTTPEAITRAGLLWADTTSEFEAIAGLSMLTITDSASWDALLAAWPGENKPAMSVDFSTNMVVLVQDDVSSTCGLSIPSHGVWQPDGYAPRVYARFSDSSGACSWSCDMTQQGIVVYAVPFADGYPVVCAEELDRCDM